MTTKFGPRLNGGVAAYSVSHIKSPARLGSRLHTNRRSNGIMEGGKEIKTADDVDKESKPVENDGRGSSNTLHSSVNNKCTDDVLSVSHMPNAVNSSSMSVNSNGNMTNYADVKSLQTTLNDISDMDKKCNSQLSDNKSHNSETTSVKSDSKTKTTTSETISMKSLIKSKMKQITSEKSVHIDVPNQGMTAVRKDSLTVPTAGMDAQTTDGPATRRDSSASSRRPSIGSQMSRRSIDDRVEYMAVQMPPEEKKSVFSPEDSWIRVAIPYLPVWVAVICLLMNIFIPGSGTLLSGACILCCGKSRVPHKYDQDAILILCVNTWVGVAQLFTVTFLLVGWFWSLAWGIKMVILAVEHKRELAEQRAIELQTMALNAFGNALENRARF